jgi:DNA-binding MarR family transcriptional regulator
MEAIKLKRIVIKEELFSITNDTIESIILGQFIYWQERVKDYDLFLKEEERRCLDNSVPFNVNLSNGWIYKKSSDLIDECMLSISENTVRRYINNLEEKGFISSRKNPNFKWDRTLQYRANMKFIIESIKNKGFDGLGGWNIQNKVTKLQNDDSSSQNEGALPEITIENTNNKESTYVDKKKTKNEEEITNEDYRKFRIWMNENCPYCNNPRNMPSSTITQAEFLKLKSEYSGIDIAETILEIENRKDLRKKYANLYRTTLNWLKNRNK